MTSLLPDKWQGNAYKPNYTAPVEHRQNISVSFVLTPDEWKLLDAFSNVLA